MPNSFDGTGLPIEPTAVLLSVLFQIPDVNGNLSPVNINPGSGSVQFLLNDVPVTTPDPIDSTLNAGPQNYTINQVAGQTGLYRFQFLTTNMLPGVYTVVWSGTATVGTSMPTTHTLVISGTLGIGSISRIQDYMERVRARLMDDHPQDYQLDVAGKNQWSKVNIFYCLRDAIDRINATGPRYTQFSMENIPNPELLVTGAMVFALYARARFEGANTMDYSDGHTLRIDRGPFYKQLADTLREDWLAAIKGWKIATPPIPIGIRTQRLPFRITRVLGLLPNYSTYFSS